MKRILKLSILLILVLSICGCGKSEAVKNVEEMIAALDTVTADSGEQIEAAVLAYQALTAEEMETVKNYEALQNVQAEYVEVLIDAIGTISIDSLDAIETAKKAYEGLDDDLKDRVQNYGAIGSAERQWAHQYLVGEWVNSNIEYRSFEKMYSAVDFTVYNDNTFANSYSTTLKWEIKNGYLQTVTDSYKIRIEDGYVTLDSSYSYMRTDDFREMLDKMFVIVELTPDNVEEYFRCARYTEDGTYGDGTFSTYLTLESAVYDDLIFVEASDDAAVELCIPKYTSKVSVGNRSAKVTQEAEKCILDWSIYGETCSLIDYDWGSWEQTSNLAVEDVTFGRAQGTLYFVRKEFVQNVTHEDNSKYVRLITGEKLYAGIWREGLNY